jgi:hypothetical protein
MPWSGTENASAQRHACERPRVAAVRRRTTATPGSQRLAAAYVGTRVHP